MGNKAKAKTVYVSLAYTLSCVGIQRTEHELICHSLVLKSIKRPELVTVLNKMCVTMKWTGEWHDGPESTKRGSTWSTVWY
jgi:hypothetical protein